MKTTEHPTLTSASFEDLVQEMLVRLGEDRYLFLFDLPAKPGKNTLQIYWADAQHRMMADSVQQITVTVAHDAPQ